MTWLGWWLLGLITGVTLAALLVAAVGRGTRERSGTLTFDSPEARGVFKHAREASEYERSLRRIQDASSYDRDRIIAEERERVGFPIAKFVGPGPWAYEPVSGSSRSGYDPPPTSLASDWVGKHPDCTCPSPDTMVGNCPRHGDAARIAGAYVPLGRR